MEVHKAFCTPLFRYKNNEHSSEKNIWMEYFNQNDVYKSHSYDNHPTKFTGPELYKEDVFKNLLKFIQSCVERSMVELGYVPNAQITSMWSTKHTDMGSHHRHSHANSFLSGIYYLSGNEKHSGTIFFSPHRYFNHIDPERIKGRETFFNNRIVSNFEEGTLLIFPSWLEHATSFNEIKTSKQERYIISFNSMPVGKTNVCVYDRYNYNLPNNASLVNLLSDIWNP